MSYDPLNDPDSKEWLAMDEQERMTLIEDYHRRHRVRLPNVKVHAIVHSVVENQIAMGDQYETAAVLRRLRSEGLDRHEAVHAIGSVVAGEMFSALKQPGAAADLTDSYLTKLRQLTAASWRSMETK